VLGGGADVAADGQAGAGDFLGLQPAGDLLLRFLRPQPGLSGVVRGGDLGVEAERDDVVVAVA